MSASRKPDQFLVLVRGIPLPEEGDTYSEKVEKFFIEFQPLHYLPHQMVFHSADLEIFLKRFDKVKARVAALKTVPVRKPCRIGFLGLYGPKMDPLEYETQKLEELYAQIRERQANIYDRKAILHVYKLAYETRGQF